MIREPLCRGRSCLVVGSSPKAPIHLSSPDIPSDCVVLGANGGADVARRAGLIPDVLVTTSYLFRHNVSPQELATRDFLRNLFVQSLWVDEKGGPATSILAELSALPVHYNQLVGVPPIFRSEIVRGVVGDDLWVSTGVWAICLALYSGASRVVVAGISLGVGHAFMDQDQSHRYHTEEDGLALNILRSRKDVTILE